MSKKFFTLIAFILLATVQVFAQAPHAEEGLIPKIEKGPVGMLVYSVLGLIILAGAFKMIDILTPGNLAKQIAEDRNIALAIVIAGAMIGISMIIASAII
jgi:hypothetical protein